MFLECNSLDSLDLSNFDTSKVTNMYAMFGNCYSLTSLNLDKFNSSKVENMAYMFYNCYLLKSLDLSSFNTSLVTDMSAMFWECYSLTSLNLSNFDTSQVKNMNSLFRDCYSLTSLDLSKFNTSQVEEMACLFINCPITSIDLSSFDTSHAIRINDMFHNCSSLLSVDLSNFNISKVKYMNGIFYNCKNLTSINLSNFNKLIVSDLSYLFSGCTSLISIDLSNFDTSEVVYMEYMFRDCKSLSSINISNFNTSNVKYMYGMFSGCESLQILDFSNFNISNIRNMDDIFLNCTKLVFINIKNYVTNIIFENNYGYYLNDTVKNMVICSEDEILNSIIDKFECHSVNCLNDWYSHKKKINSIDGSCTYDCSLTNYKYEYNEKCYLKCESGTYNNNYQCEKCHPDCKECNGTYNLNYSNCISCSLKSNYLYFGNCISKCPRGYYYDNNYEQNICICELPQCYLCSIESLNRNLCLQCETGYYPIYDNNNLYDINLYKNCSKYKEGYYLDNDLVLKLCYKSCKKCNISGNEEEHNCIECKYNYNFEIKFDIYKNCYINCSYYHYFDTKLKKSICTISNECPINIYDKRIEEKKECVSNCTNDEYYKYEYQKRCYQKCPLNSTVRENITILGDVSYDLYFCKPICLEEKPFEIIHLQECVKNCPIKYIIDESCILNYLSIKIEENKDGKEGKEESQDNEGKYKENTMIEKNEKTQKEENIKAHDIMAKNVEEDFTSDNYDTKNLDNGNNEVVEFRDMKIILTTVENQVNNNNSNETNINFKECENELRKVYKIPDNQTIYMKKTEVEQKGMQIPKIEYDVYSKLNGTNLIKLDLSYCKKVKIVINVPVKLIEDIDKHNSSSGYYNDLCYTATSDSGTDIILDDRKIEFIKNNKTLCQESCIFSEYDNNLKKAKCTCNVKESSSSFANINININLLYQNFLNIKNIANFQLLRCYKVLFSKKGIVYNYGSYSLIFIIILHIIFIILYYCKNLFNKIKEKIEEITFALKHIKYVKAEEKKEERLKKEKEKELKKLKEQRLKKEKERELKKLKQNELKKEKQENQKNINNEHFIILPPIYYSYAKYIKDTPNPSKRKKTKTK